MELLLFIFLRILNSFFWVIFLLQDSDIQTRFIMLFKKVKLLVHEAALSEYSLQNNISKAKFAIIFIYLYFFSLRLIILLLYGEVKLFISCEDWKIVTYIYTVYFHVFFCSETDLKKSEQLLKLFPSSKSRIFLKGFFFLRSYRFR